MKITLEQIVIAGIHLGHPVYQCHPKISAYTYGDRGGIHVIDLVKTRQSLIWAGEFVIEVSKEGKDIIFIGTKSQAACAIKERAQASQSFFIHKHWLGGTLTNWPTVRASILQLHRLERDKRRGVWGSLKKKKVAWLQKRLDRLSNYLGGLKGMRSLPGAVVVVGQTTELVAIRECRKLGIPVVCRLDTDCDPHLAEVGVPINDDSTASIRLFLEFLLPRIHEGKRQQISKQTKFKIGHS